MQSQNRSASKEQAPDPATVYERAKPENEAGMGRLDKDKTPPVEQRDRLHQAGQNRRPSRQINADDDQNQRNSSKP